jgi:hypothetical protein
MVLIARLTLVVLLLAGATACRKAQAHTPPSSPPLDTPEPPTRVVIPVSVDPDEPPPPDPEPEPPSRRTVPPRPPARTTPPPVVRTADVVVLERQARTLMARADRDLATVDYDELNRDARGQFDTAKRFLRMAGAALEVKNYRYARQLADNAAALAAQLVKAATSL